MVHPLQEQHQSYACTACSEIVAVTAPEHVDMTYATCPRCNVRNPVGVALVAEKRRFNLIGAIVSAGIGIATWFFPWLAWLLVAFVVLIAVGTTLALRRAPPSNQSARMTVISNFVGLVIALTVAWFAPRWLALYPLVLFVQFLRYRAKAEARWKEVALKLRATPPYR